MDFDGRAGEYAVLDELDEEDDYLDRGERVGNPWNLEGEERRFATPW